MDNFSNLMMINECLLDKKRVKIFESAIRSVVKKGDVVLDAGTGSGIMALLAASAGAKKVYAVEIDDYITDIVRRNVHNSQLNNVVEAVCTDISKFKSDRVDVVIMEMMDTWMAAEQQIPAINNLIKNGVIDKNTLVIPKSFDNYIQFINYDFTFYGFDMTHPIQARNFGVLENVKARLSNNTLVESINLSQINELSRKCSLTVKATKTGIVNAVILKTHTHLTNVIKTWGTTDLNMPVILPIRQLEVREGEVVNIRIEYIFSEGFRHVLIEI